MTPIEAKIVDMCAEILGLRKIDLNDNLFDLGSDSHQAVLVALEIEAAFDVSLPLEVMESTPTARALAAWVVAQQLGRRADADADADAERNISSG